MHAYDMMPSHANCSPSGMHMRRFLPDVVLYPRHAITLQFNLPNERCLLDLILSSPSKLIVVCGRRERGLSSLIGSVGVTAELRGVKRGQEGSYAQALGCQRCRLERMECSSSIDDRQDGATRKEPAYVWRVLSSGNPGPIPMNFIRGYSFWSEAETRRYDPRVILTELVDLAGRLVPKLASDVLRSSSGSLNLDPDVISWRLAWNLPMSSEMKLTVLSCHSLVGRLGLIADFLRDQDGVLGCTRCSSVIARSDDLLHRCRSLPLQPPSLSPNHLFFTGQMRGAGLGF